MAQAYQFAGKCYNCIQSYGLPFGQAIKANLADLSDRHSYNQENLVIRRTNIPYVTRNGVDLLLDIVAPEGVPATPRPAIVYVHGGGWLAGEKTTSSNDWLAEAGFFTVSINYRLTNVSPFPAQIHDVKAAIRWVRANAAHYHVDPDRIGVWGSSAGGHLSALCAVTNGDDWYAGGEFDVSSDVQCAVPICPPSDFLIDWYAAGNIPVHEEAEMCLEGLIGGTALQHPELAKQASPLWQATADAVPQLVIQGGADDLVPAGQVRAYVSALMQRGADVTYLEYPDETHAVDAGIFLENGDHLGLREIIIPFFRWHLMGESSS